MGELQRYGAFGSAAAIRGALSRMGARRRQEPSEAFYLPRRVIAQLGLFPIKGEHPDEDKT